MKELLQSASLLLLTAAACIPGNAQAEGDVSFNIGFASEYYYRGILQNNSSASAGIDFEHGGFYAGAWTADVGDGLEIDGFFGYGVETETGISASIGFTGYYYTGGFDDSYEEINFNIGYKMLSLEYSVGEWDGFGDKADYDFLALTLQGENGLYVTFGSFGNDFDGEYFELGYNKTIADFDLGVALISSSKELSDQVNDRDEPEGSEAIIFSIGKTF